VLSVAVGTLELVCSATGSVLDLVCSAAFLAASFPLTHCAFFLAPFLSACATYLPTPYVHWIHPPPPHPRTTLTTVTTMAMVLVPRLLPVRKARIQAPGSPLMRSIGRRFREAELLLSVLDGARFQAKHRRPAGQLAEDTYREIRQKRCKRQNSCKRQDSCLP
jgi:hypothetical protein